MDPLKVGIAGVSAEKGWAAAAHLPALKELPGYQVSAISHHSAAQAEKAAEAFGVPAAFTDNERLFASEDLDLVVVTVSVPRHLELVGSAIKAGRNVFSEWPLGRTLAEAESLYKMALTAGVRGFIGLQSRSVPAVLYVRDLIQQGAIGEVLSTTMIGSGIFYGAAHGAGSAYAVDAANGAGMINVTFANAIDALCFVLGEFSELSATLANRRKTTTIIETGESIPMTVYDQVAVTGVLADGAVATVHYRGGTSRATNMFWEINGTQGDIVLSAAGGHLGVYPVSVRLARGADTELKELSVPKNYFPLSDTVALIAQNVGANYLLIESDLRTGTRLAPDFGDAVVRQRMVAAIERAAATGCKQTYNTNPDQ